MVSKRKAFTAIELLIAIGIIAILAALLVLGLKAIVGSATGSASQVGLANARSMLADLEVAGSLDTQIGPIYGGPTISFNTVQVIAPESVTVDTYESSTSILTNDYRFLSPAVVNTQRVMGKLRSVPSNRALLEKLAADHLLRPQTGGKAYGALVPTPSNPISVSASDPPANQPHGHPDPPILVDSWNNPIIFVPPGGLQVAFAYNGAKFYAVGQVAGTAPTFYRCVKGNQGQAQTNRDFWEPLAPSFSAIVKSPDSRAFFASAGPDGDFSAPMDNLYSFEN